MLLKYLRATYREDDCAKWGGTHERSPLNHLWKIHIIYKKHKYILRWTTHAFLLFRSSSVALGVTPAEMRLLWRCLRLYLSRYICTQGTRPTFHIHLKKINYRSFFLLSNKSWRSIGSIVIHSPKSHSTHINAVVMAFDFCAPLYLQHIPRWKVSQVLLGLTFTTQEEKSR